MSRPLANYGPAPHIPNAVILEYDTDKYPFKRVLETHVFRVPDLAQLHTFWMCQTDRKKLDYYDNMKLRSLMQKLPDDALFYRVYHAWVEQQIAPFYRNRISYSHHPKMRVHLSGTGTVSDFHRDADVTKRPEQINIYLPFTDVRDGATLWCERDYGSSEFVPLNLRYGEALLWDGGYLSHGTKFNDTDATRVSCDLRFHAIDMKIVDPPWSRILSGREKVIEI
ncbi:streptomycin biosynthesis enzyme StrG [Ruegeria atlantica]|uniref:streptomycin biosynthesis enzyme StrG n=1 Tax=Ruegeria atlantica TaxID=81569 RepID=UPI001480EBDC|nr:streptomycin biosynthesis enzyme StrG [Ruegeria atlantica]